jgi:hypothetical protein
MARFINATLKIIIAYFVSILVVAAFEKFNTGED